MTFGPIIQASRGRPWSRWPQAEKVLTKHSPIVLLRTIMSHCPFTYILNGHPLRAQANQGLCISDRLCTLQSENKEQRTKNACHLMGLALLGTTEQLDDHAQGNFAP